jgi:hypothetical protein
MADGNRFASGELMSLPLGRFDSWSVFMEPWMTMCVRLGKAKRSLTFAEVNEHAPADLFDSEKLDEFLLLLEKEGIELCDDFGSANEPGPGRRGEMVYHRFATALLEGWKNYPVRIRGPRPSECHGSPTLLVQSMTGGFVSANCSACGKKQTLGKADFFNLFLWVSCPRCRARMEPEMLSRVNGACQLAGNYGYKCDKCQIYILFADLLPRWQDLV